MVIQNGIESVIVNLELTGCVVHLKYRQFIYKDIELLKQFYVKLVDTS
jgi:hypothetical protein